LKGGEGTIYEVGVARLSFGAVYGSESLWIAVGFQRFPEDFVRALSASGAIDK